MFIEIFLCLQFRTIGYRSYPFVLLIPSFSTLRLVLHPRYCCAGRASGSEQRRWKSASLVIRTCECECQASKEPLCRRMTEWLVSAVSELHISFTCDGFFDFHKLFLNARTSLLVIQRHRMVEFQRRFVYTLRAVRQTSRLER